MSALRSFPLPARAPTWYIGHMAKSMREFPALLRDIDVVIEARDARVPLSGVNAGLEGVVRRSWGLPAVGTGRVSEWRYGAKSGMSDGASTELDQKAQDAGPSSVRMSTSTAVGLSGRVEPEEGAGVVSTDRKGKGKATVRERVKPEWAIQTSRGMTDEEREERLAQIQRQGGRMRERVVVYTKRDLAEQRFEEPLKAAFWQHARQRVFFANTDVDQDVGQVMRYIVDLAKRHISLTGNTTTPINILVVGMPNVGKSSLLNALRRIGVKKGKAFRTSAKPGHTRKLTGTVRIHDDPLIYVYDAPGVMVPFLGRGDEGVEKGLKLALTSGMKEGLVPEEVIAEYLLHLLNTYHYPDIFLAPQAVDALDGPADGTDTGPGSFTSAWIPPSSEVNVDTANQECDRSIRLAKERPAKTYLHHLALPPTFQPTDSLADFLAVLAQRLGALRKGGEPDTDHAQTFFLRMFREGKLGRVTVDDLGRCMPIRAGGRRDAGEATAVDAGAGSGDDNAIAAGTPQAAQADGQPGASIATGSSNTTANLQLSTIAAAPTPNQTSPLPDPDERIQAAVRAFLQAQTTALEAALRQDDGDVDSPFVSDTQRSKRDLERKKAERKEYKARKQAGSMSGSGGAPVRRGGGAGYGGGRGGGAKRGAPKGRWSSSSR